MAHGHFGFHVTVEKRMHGLLEVVSNFFEPRFASKSPYSLLLHFVCMMNMEDDVVDLCFARAEKNCQPS